MSLEGGRLLQQLAELLLHGAATTPSHSVEALLAEAVRRTLLSTDVTVLWRSHLADSLTTAAGATCTDLGSPAAPLSAADARGAGWPPAVHHPQRKQLVRVVFFEQGELRLGLGQRDGAQTHEVFIRAHATADAAERLAAFADAARLEYSQLAHLFKIVSALRGASATRQQATFRQDVARLLALTPPDPTPHLSTATALLGRLHAALADPWYTDDLLLLSEQIVEWGLHGLLGSGWASQPLAVPTIRDFCDAVHRLRGALPDTQPLAARLTQLEATLRAQLPGTPWPSGAPAGALSLLATWAGLHRCARAIDHTGRFTPADEAGWAAAATAARGALAGQLAEWAQRSQRAAPLTRNWMRLWFALQLLTPPDTHPAAPDRLTPSSRPGAERWRFRADLAYVIQEGLRFARYGHRPGYRSQPPAFSAALRTLVAHHARLEGGLPRELDVHAHLVEIAEGSRAGGFRFAAGHLQHVLEIYIAGHFFCAVQRDGTPIGDLLASSSGLRPGQHARAELRAAFSLAALFHDTGAILFPQVHPVGDGITRGEPELTGALRDTSDAVTAAGARLAETCVAALAEKATTEPVSEPALARWLDEQQRHGRPDHGLLGAWYLLRRCERLPLPEAAVKAAARAVLLHSAVRQTVDPDLDPAAALLILCDELFEWEPSLAAGPSPNAVGRSLHAAAVEHNPLRSRAAVLQIHGFAAEAGPGGLRMTLKACEGGAWPVFSVALQPPGVMEEPAFRVWMTMAQNLGRLRAAQSGWGPTVRLSATIPPRVSAILGSTTALLDRAVHTSRLAERSWLQAWLSGQQPRVDGDTEHFTITAAGRAMTPGDVRSILPALKDEALQILEDLERRAERGHNLSR